ncbi:MAG: TMEM175 family protein [Bacteroidota bacterium]
MNKGRVEAFSDGVLAIIITIMVLELRVPAGDTLAALRPLIPKFLSYLLSFIFIGIYWNNHHHLWQAVKRVNGSILWANLHLLFWLSLIPFVTGWMGEHHFATVPVALYGGVLWLSGMAYYIMVLRLLAYHGEDSLLVAAIGDGRKERLSLFIYTAAVPIALLNSWMALALYVTVAILWLIPDRRIEKVFDQP